MDATEAQLDAALVMVDGEELTIRVSGELAPEACPQEQQYLPA